MGHPVAEGVPRDPRTLLRHGETISHDERREKNYFFPRGGKLPPAYGAGRERLPALSTMRLTMPFKNPNIFWLVYSSGT